MVWLLSCFSFWFAWLDSYCCSARKESRNISVKFLFFYVGSGSPLLFMFTVIYGKDGRWSVISFTESPLFLHISCKYIVYDCGWMCSNFTLFCDCGIYSLQKNFNYCHVKITTYKFDILLRLCIHFNLFTPWTCLRHNLGPGKHSLSWCLCSCSYQSQQLCIHKQSADSICQLHCTLIFPFCIFCSVCVCLCGSTYIMKFQ